MSEMNFSDEKPMRFGRTPTMGQPGKWHQQVGGSVAPFGLQVIGQFVAQFHQQVKRFKLSKFVTGPLGGVVMWLIAEVVIVLMDKFSGRLADDQA